MSVAVSEPLDAVAVWLVYRSLGPLVGHFFPLDPAVGRTPPNLY